MLFIPQPAKRVNFPLPHPVYLHLKIFCTLASLVYTNHVPCINYFTYFHSTDETSLTIPSPVTKVINQTYIKVTLKSPPSLPPRENWTHIPKYELFYRRDKFGNYIKFALNGSLPISVDITGLRNYTKYLFHARYYGYANNSTTLNIISSLRSATTAEDGK